MTPRPAHDSAAAQYRAWGGLAVARSRRDWVRAIAVGSLLGLGAVAVRAISALGVRRWARTAERGWARLAIRMLGIRLAVEGLEHIDPHRRYVVIALHESFLDALAIARLPLLLTGVARDELTDMRFVGPQLRAGRHILIRPEQPLAAARSLLESARTATAGGDSVLVFPQGAMLGIEIAFQRGAFALARRLDCPVLPIVITGGHRAWAHPFSGAICFGTRMSVRVLPAVPGAIAVHRRRAIEAAMKASALAPGMAPVRHFVPERDGFWDGYRYDIDPAYVELAGAVRSHREGRDGSAASPVRAARVEASALAR